MFVLGGFVALLSLLHAQETALPVQLQPIQSDSLVSLTAEAQGLERVAPADLPRSGTFWLVMPGGGMAPLPCPPADANWPVYQIADGIFLVDATDGQVRLNTKAPNNTMATALAAQADVVVNLINQVQEAQFTREFAMAFGFEDELDASDSFSPMALLYDPAGLWLEITNVSNVWSYFNLHNATNSVYAIWTTTNLLTSWQVETELWPTNPEVMPFSLPTLDRENLFVRAQDWTGLDSNGDGIPDWWVWKYFGTLSLSATNLDGIGNPLSLDYTNNLVPAVFQFSGMAAVNNYVSYTPVPVLLDVTGYPCYVAVLVDDTNFSNAVWHTYSSSTMAANLGITEGWHEVWIGLRGHADDASAAVWKSTRLNLDWTSPNLTITQPTGGTVSQPMTQVQGFGNESLGHVTFDVSNAAGNFTNQTGYIMSQFYDANLLAFTTNYFQCFDVGLTNGLNIITVHAADLAGNQTTAIVNVTLSYAGVINPPSIGLIWPTNGTPISGSQFTVQLSVSDPTAKVQVNIVDADGHIHAVQGSVDRDGQVLVSNLPLSSGVNTVTITTTGAAGKSSTTTYSVVGNDVGLIIDPLPSDQLNKTLVNITGRVADSSYVVMVNGNAATVYSGGFWEAVGVPVSASGTASVYVYVYDANNNLLSSQSMVLENPSLVLVTSYEEIDHPTFKNHGCGQSTSSSSSRTVSWTLGIGGYSQQHSDSWLAVCDSYVAWPTNWPAGETLVGESCIGNYSEVEAQAWQHCSINQSAADSGDDDCGGTFHAFYTLSRTADTKIELVAGKETQSGAPKLILLTASAARYSELAVDLVEPGIAWQQWSLDGGGDVPLPAAAIQILGQVLTASATNENVGKTLVTMKPGSSQAITPVISYPLNQNYYSFDVKATDVDLQLAMDNNRDGDITFDGADQTSAEKSYRFWVNDDQDYTASLAGNNAISGLEETVPVLTPDYSRNEIKTIRDLEDFTRLNILVQGITNELADGTFRVGVKWKHTTGTPALKLFRNLSPDGGPEYLTDVGVAQQFLDLSNPGSVAGTETYLIPTSFWQWAGINTTNNQGALIFEGCSAGKGELVLTINKPDGTELAEVGSAWLELKNIKELYQRGEEPGLNQWPSVTFDPDPNEGKEAIVFVHGWRMSPEGASEFAETMFKRLWQRGYKGRFAAFRWNTHWNGIDFGWVPYVGGGINAYLADFNGSESNAWAAGAALKNFVDTLPAGYTKNIAAHSMGNIVAGSALLSGMTIDNYALLQAAVPACSYDDSAEMQQNQPYFHYGTILVWDGLSRPDFDSDPATRALSYRGRLANVQGNLVNFALTNDYATFDAWEVNNEITKPLGPMSGDYYYYPQNPVGERLFYQKTAGGITYTRYMSNPFEAMPYACRAWSKAAGAELNTHGAISSTVDLSSPAYNLPGQPNDTGFYKEHSAEFNYPIQNLKQFYTELLRQLNVNFNP